MLLFAVFYLRFHLAVDSLQMSFFLNEWLKDVIKHVKCAFCHFYYFSNLKPSLLMGANRIHGLTANLKIYLKSLILKLKHT